MRTSARRNSPFFSYRISWLDVVEAEPETDGFPFFVRVVEKSGNRTMRVIVEGFKVTSKKAKSFLDSIVALGCSYEGLQPRLLSITIPAEVELEKVAEFLIVSGHEWECADPKYEDLFPEG